MNTIVRSIQAFGLDLSLSIHFGNGQASADVGFRGQRAQGPRLQAQNTCDDSAVHDLMTEVHQLIESAYEQYRAARMCQWTAQLVAPVGVELQLSVFDQWLLEKLMTSCPNFQLGWTPLQDHPTAFRLIRDGSTLRMQARPVSGGIICMGVVSVGDAHTLVNAVREFIGQVTRVSVLAEAAD